MPSHRAPLHVTILGGGPAAAELLLALRALAEDRVEIEVIAPDRALPVRAASTAAALGSGAMEIFDLAALADEVGARLRIDAAEAVAPTTRSVRLRSGGRADYDVLVVATGARARIGVAGATTFRDQRDMHVLRAAVDDLGDGTARSIAFAAPAGVVWTLPLYELALLAAERVDSDSIVVATPERRALEVFGDTVSARVEALLSERDIRLRTRTPAVAVGRGQLNLFGGGSLAADRVIALPRLVGQRVGGIPADWNGFVPTDAWGAVRDIEDVYAIGDVRACPVKQGGLATQQADVVASVIAARAGADVVPSLPRYVLRTRLLGTPEPLYLRVELDAAGRPLASSPEPLSTEPPWWPAAKLVGRYLAPWMASHTAMEEVMA